MVPYGAAARYYYDPSPDAPHRTGDIWRGLPSLGLLGPELTCSGLVITPACDLANDKSATVTYLPIVTIREYLASAAGYTLLRSTLCDLMQGRLKIGGIAEMLPRGRVPDSDTIGTIESLVGGTEVSDKGAYERITAGLSALRCIVRRDLEAASKIRRCLAAKEWQRFKENIATNSLVDDTHFLPAEQPAGDWSAVKEPSLVMFRYPITVPRFFLDLANDETELWVAQQAAMPIKAIYTVDRPLKVLRLRKEFLSDLLTRFARLYVRIGSPDFTADAVRSIATAIDEVCEQ